MKKNAEETAGDFIVPLAPLAVSAFRSLHELAGGSGWVLPARRRNGVEDHLHESTLCKLTHSLLEPRTDRAPMLAGMQPFSPHDLRRTARSYFTARLDADPIIAERCLGHAVGNAVFRAYDVGDYLPQRRALLEKWAAFVERLVYGVDAQVAFLPARQQP